LFRATVMLQLVPKIAMEIAQQVRSELQMVLQLPGHLLFGFVRQLRYLESKRD
jgi:hypothetical protein